AAGPIIIDSARPVRIPRVSAAASAAFVAEGALISDSAVPLDEIDLMPSSLKSIKVWVPFSNELIRESAIGLDAVLRARLVTDVSNALDAALFTGAGTANTIKGITNQPGVQTGVLNATNPDTLLDAIALAQAQNVTPNRWFMNPGDYISLRKLRATSSDGRYLLDPDAHEGTQYSIFGIPLTVTNRLPTGKAILADMQHVVVVRDVDASIFVADQTLANYDAQAIRVVTRYDVGLTQPLAVVVLTAA
ncbi:MAG: phage major capsid protein, partial [Mycobacterium sp.]|nr:phage major capsid protein [Mycobacterium sp.]